MSGYNDLIDSLARPSPAPDDGESALRSTYRWIEAFMARAHYSPTLFEIAQGMGISYQTARSRRGKMAERRWLSCDGKKRSIVLLGIPAVATPTDLTFNALASLSDHLAVAMAGHERGPELFALFGEAYHVKLKELEMEAALVEAERLGENSNG